jgi:hypothetical protein
MKLYFQIIIIVLLFFGFSACEDRMDCVCTQEYRWITVHIQVKDGTTVDSLKTWTRKKLTGQLLRADTSIAALPHPTGDYTILTDGEKGFFTSTQETVIFQANNSQWSMEREYEFYVDDCGCHIRKSSGADSIIVN